MRGAVAAGSAGCFEAYVDCVFRFMWREPRKLDDPEMLRAPLGEAGLDVDAPLKAGATSEVKTAMPVAPRRAIDRPASRADTDRN